MEEIMARSRIYLALAALAFVAVTGIHAQTQSGTKSASIQIVAVVPTMLKLSVDFCAGAVAQVKAFLSSKTPETVKSAASSGFEIKENSVMELGDARIFSNTTGSYSVDVYSANGGSLRNESNSAGSDIPYSLSFGGISAKNRDGAFSFQTRGKSQMDGSTMKVALAIASVPSAALVGRYSDQLMFSLSAN